MTINRREFLKIAGMSTLAGLGSASVITSISRGQLEASQISPGPEALIGKRWGLIVDMSKFQSEEDYKRVADACHTIHNVPDLRNPKHEIKWIWNEKFVHAFPEQEDHFLPEDLKHKPFIVLCNHCDNPPCVRVCPTKATFKRKDGIVMMDMHRCIGCRFCMAACPYGARSFNWRDPRGKDENGRPFIEKENPEFPMRTKGVVEKCTLCYERLAEGLKPACVEKSNGGLIFGDLDDPDSEIREVLRTQYTIRRKPELGTRPSLYYVIGGNDNA